MSKQPRDKLLPLGGTAGRDAAAVMLEVWEEHPISSGGMSSHRTQTQLNDDLSKKGA